jgi:hypothetical protein
VLRDGQVTREVRDERLESGAARTGCVHRCSRLRDRRVHQRDGAPDAGADDTRRDLVAGSDDVADVTAADDETARSSTRQRDAADR